MQTLTNYPNAGCTTTLVRLHRPSKIVRFLNREVVMPACSSIEAIVKDSSGTVAYIGEALTARKLNRQVKKAGIWLARGLV